MPDLTHVNVHDVELEPWPLPDPESGLEVEGDPILEGRILWVSDDGCEAVGTQRITPCVMRGTHVDETSFFVSGHATIRPDGGEPIEARGGQLLHFDGGLRTEWTVHTTTFKVFHLRSSEPLGF